MKSELEKLVGRYRELGIDRQLDYEKFYLYSIITHSTAIEGSTITELENQIMFDNGIALKGKSLVEQNMNLDLKAAYERALVFAREHADVTIERLKELSALTMKNTGSEYHTALGDFSSANGDIRLVNVTAGVGGRSYMAFNKVPQKLKELYNSKDYGQYGKNGEMPVCFIVNTDNTGGNSGSPVFNSKGQLIGTAFDRNFEGLTGDIAFRPSSQRAACVDIRYTLFIIDKFAGASHIIDELTICEQ